MKFWIATMMMVATITGNAFAQSRTGILEVTAPNDNVYPLSGSILIPAPNKSFECHYSVSITKDNMSIVPCPQNYFALFNLGTLTYFGSTSTDFVKTSSILIDRLLYQKVQSTSSVDYDCDNQQNPTSCFVEAHFFDANAQEICKYKKLITEVGRIQKIQCNGQSKNYTAFMQIKMKSAEIITPNVLSEFIKPVMSEIVRTTITKIPKTFVKNN